MNAIATTEKPTTLRQQVDQMKPEFAKTLPSHINPDKFTRDLQTVLNLNPDLAQASPKSIFASALKAAADGLSLDGREAALVIRNVNVGTKDAKKWEKQATYLPMVQGLMKLARNSGEISSLTAQVVYANDKFVYSLGDDERIEHQPAGITEDQGAPVAVYAIAKLKDGTVIREVMRRSAVISIGAQGSNSFQYDPGSGKNFAEWWRKTALRRIAKYIPRSSDEVGRLVTAIEAIDADYEYAEEAAPVAAIAAPRVRAADRLKGKVKEPEAPAQGKVAEGEPGYGGNEDRVAHDPDTGEIDDSLAATEGVAYIDAGQPGDEF